MAYEVDLDRGVMSSITRVYRKTLKKAGRALTGPAASGERVHEARTGVKRARTLLRLVRGQLPGSRFRRANGALREAGRALSPVRDAVILVDAIDALLEHAGEDDRARLAPLREALAAQREARVAGSGDLLAEAAHVLDRARDRASDLAVGHRGWKALASGIERVYRRGQARFERVCATDRDEDFHALRRSVKDLAYQARLLRPIDEPALRAEEERLKQLGRLLGDDHDLVVLTAFARRSPDDADPAALERLDALAAARRAELRSEARSLAESFFTEGPSQRLARLEAGFRRARAVAAAPVRQAA